MDGHQGTFDGRLGGAGKKHGDRSVGRYHECGVCGKSFTKKHYLDDHRIIHLSVKPHACPICGKRFAGRSNFNYHKRSHTRTVLYACELCPSRFCKKQSLNRHKQLHYRGVNLYHCDECGKGLRSKKGLEKHHLWHKGEKPYTCHLCPAAFMYSNDLDRHSLVHTGERPHACSVCQKSFAQKKNLDFHMYRVHSGPVPRGSDGNGMTGPLLPSGLSSGTSPGLPQVDENLSCHLCPAVFECSSDMDKHVVTHIGERPHICPLCQKCFAWKNNLVLHMQRRHSGVKASVEATDMKGELTLLNGLPSTLAPDITSADIKLEPGSPTTTLPPVITTASIKAEPASPTAISFPIIARADIKVEPSSLTTLQPPNITSIAVKAEPCCPTTSPPIMTSIRIKAEPSSPTTTPPFV